MLEYNITLPGYGVNMPVVSWNTCVDMCKTAHFQASYEFVIGYVFSLSLLLSRRFITDIMIRNCKTASQVHKVDKFIYNFALLIMFLTTLFFLYLRVSL